MPEQYKRNPNTNCSVCGKPIYRRPGVIKENLGRSYCGQVCYGLACRKEKPCIVCGKPIMSSLNKITCSRACSNIYRTGIKYKIGRPRDKAVVGQMLKLKLLEQRGKNCERCGYDKFEILQTHHKDRNHDNNNLDNLELICPNCHYEEHLLEKSWLRKRIIK